MLGNKQFCQVTEHSCGSYEAAEVVADVLRNLCELGYSKDVLNGAKRAYCERFKSLWMFRRVCAQF